jgi:L-aminopeptidase/D-esterase-like protein
VRLAFALLALVIAAQAGARARDLGIPFEGTPGPLNAITDVPGIEVGQETLIEGDGPLKTGAGPVRTGVTMVLPRGRSDGRAVTGGFFDLNGNGEMTGRAYLEDFGIVQGPIGLTDSNAIGQVYAGIQQWTSKRTGSATWPVVAETWSGYLNDIEGFHVTADSAKTAIDKAKPGPVEEGSVGGGTGMICFGFKGGIGTASRVLAIEGKSYTVGVLVQCNTGDRKVLRIAGAPVGQRLAKRWLRCFDSSLARASGDLPPCTSDGTHGKPTPDEGSIIILVGTDAPMTPLQLNRIARRAAMGLARLGSYSGNQSGDLILSFSTATPDVNAAEQGRPSPVLPLGNLAIDPLFEASVQATEEAIVNALVAARTMTGINGTRVYGIPHDELRSILRHYNRLEASK